MSEPLLDDLIHASLQQSPELHVHMLAQACIRRDQRIAELEAPTQSRAEWIKEADSMLGPLARHDPHIRATLEAIRYSGNPIETLCQTVIALSGGIEGMRKTLVEFHKLTQHPRVMLP